MKSRLWVGKNRYLMQERLTERRVCHIGLRHSTTLRKIFGSVGSIKLYKIAKALNRQTPEYDCGKAIQGAIMATPGEPLSTRRKSLRP